MNAVFERDFVRLSTSKRFLWMRAGLALAVAVVAGFRLLGAYATGSFDGIGEFILAISIWSGLALLLLATPGSYATVLVHARAQNTLAVLLSTPLTPFQLAWGAFVARASSLGVFVLATLPPIALGLAFGGVQVEQIAAAACSLLAAVLLAAAPSYVISAYSRRTGAAVVSSYLCSASVLAGLGALGASLSGPAMPVEAAARVSPFHGIVAALSPNAPAAAVLASSATSLLGAACACVIAVLVATYRLRSDALGGLEQVTRLAEGRAPRAMRYANPVLDRELALGAERGRGAGRALLWVLALTQTAYFAVAFAAGEQRSLALFSGFLVFEVALLLLAAAAAGATCLASEKESGALELIRATPLTPAEIVQGKLAGVLRAQLPCLAIPLIHLTWGVFAGGAGTPGIIAPAAIPYVAVAGAIVVSTWTIVGMSQSLDQRDPNRAVVRTMAALGIVGVIFAGQVGAFGLATLPEADPYIRSTIAFGANPVAAVLGGAAALRTGGSTAESASLAAPTAAYMQGAFVASVFWLGMHVAAALLVHRKLVTTYRERFEG